MQTDLLKRVADVLDNMQKIPFEDTYELRMELRAAIEAGAVQESELPAPGSTASALRSADWSGVSLGNKALIEAAAQALSNGGQLPETINVLEMTFGEPKRKLEIEGSPSVGYDAWMTDTDGDLHTIVTYAHPYAAADWCERNGFAWEVIGAVGDPVAALAAWRAEQ